MQHRQTTDGGDRLVALESSIATVLRVLGEMGISDVSEDAVIAAPPFYDDRVLLEGSGSFSHFTGQMAVNLRFVGYSFQDVAFLTVRQFCEMYVEDSFPPIPSVPLMHDQYELSSGRSSRGLTGGSAKDFPICFVLGAPRSGTTLLRAMLNAHTSLWAPGELHLANFSTMADRASHVGPILRYMPIPEAAARCGESVAAFSRVFRRWERSATPVADVFQSLHDADPGAMIVDKSPPYCARLDTLERIGQMFPNARFVHLVRSPHDVIRSYVRMQLHRGDRRLFESGRNPYQAGEAVWWACNANTEAFLSAIPAERKGVIRYEDLTSRPAESLQRVCDLLEREFEPQMADPYAAPGPTAQGAGDLLIHLLDRVEQRRSIPAFYELGGRCQELVNRYGY
jgi:hypothetical protein